MEKLFPIVRRVRRPLLPTEAESPRSAAFTPEQEDEPRRRGDAEVKPVTETDQSLVASTATSETKQAEASVAALPIITKKADASADS